VDKLAEKIDSLEAKVDSLEVRMDSLEARMHSIEARMDSLEARMDEHEKRTEKNHQILLNKLDSINEQIGILAHASVTTKGDVQVLKKKVGIVDEF